jgi:hypothetical protein
MDLLDFDESFRQEFSTKVLTARSWDKLYLGPVPETCEISKLWVGRGIFHRHGRLED